MAIELEVSGGPEAGRTVMFRAPVVTIGRGPKNDLVLQDGLVSQYHGELVLRPKGYIYRDLRSRHGTLVQLDHVTVNLHNRGKTQEIALAEGAQLMLGESVIKVRTRDGHIGEPLTLPSTTSSVSALDAAALGVSATANKAGEGLLDEHIVTRSQDSLEAVTRRLSSQDPRLVSIFKLSRRLNAASDLDDIIELIVEATFEAFPAANFFAITLVQDQNGHPTVAGAPLVARERGPHRGAASRPLLSHSLLEQVATTRESVLFVRDEAGQPVSQSIINARIMACLAAPLIGEQRLIGVMQTDTRGLGRLFGPDDLDLFTVVASYAAFAMERVRLNDNIVAMFEGFVSAAVSAVDARDPSTAGHSERVARHTVELAKAARDVSKGPLAPVEFSDSELTQLRYAALLHDFGKICVNEAVLTKAERLYPGDQRALEARFEAIKASRAVAVQRRHLDDLIRTQRVPDAASRSALDEEIAALSRELDRTLGFLLSAQGNETNDPEVIALILRFGQGRWTDLRGVEQVLLEARELEHLCVPHGTLTDTEWEHMKAHARMSRDLLAQIPWSSDLADIPCIAGWHHEKLDGSGYPDGLRADDIPWAVRILTVCDIYDALTAADRPYRRALSVSSALEVLHSEARRGLLDTALVDLFEQTVAESHSERQTRSA